MRYGGYFFFLYPRADRGNERPVSQQYRSCRQGWGRRNIFFSTACTTRATSKYRIIGGWFVCASGRRRSCIYSNFCGFVLGEEYPHVWSVRSLQQKPALSHLASSAARYRSVQKRGGWEMTGPVRGEERFLHQIKLVTEFQESINLQAMITGVPCEADRRCGYT